MEDIKKIQEFFSKSLEENKVTKEDFDKVVKILSKSKYPFTIMLVPKWGEIDIITGQDSPDEIVDDIGQRLDSAGLNWGGNSGITISGDSSNYSRREYSDIFRVNGGHQDYFEESVNEMDINDPIMMKMRAAKDKLAKMRAANAGDDGNDKFFDNAKKIAFLKKERDQLMRDMEQEAEPEGGPIADEYGAKLNRIDKAITKLSGRKEMTYDQAIAENDSYVRVSEPKFIKDKNNPNFIYVNFKYDTGGGVLTALGQETMAGQIRRLSSAEAMKQATALAKDLEAKYNLEDIDVYDKENGVVQIFAVSDNFMDMDPNMLSEDSKGALNYFNDLKYYYQKAFRYLESDEKKEYQRLAKNYFSSLKESINEYDVSMPSQEEVDKFFALTQQETHYLNSKPVMGQEGTFNLMPIEPWDEYDYSNWKALVRKANQQGKNKSISQTLAETIKLGEGVIEEELCPKGKAYIKRRKAAGEKSSAYLSGRAVKVCKGQMSGRKKRKSKKK